MHGNGRSNGDMDGKQMKLQMPESEKNNPEMLEEFSLQAPTVERETS